MDTFAEYSDPTQAYVRFTGTTLADGTIQFNKKRPFYLDVELGCDNIYLSARARIYITVACTATSTVISAPALPFDTEQNYELNMD
jgi:hypothetical protein